MQELQISVVTQQDTTRLGEFLTQHSYFARHLDWNTPLDWVGRRPFYLAEAEGIVQGIFCAVIEPEGISWLRIFAAKQYSNYTNIFKALLDPTIGELRTRLTKKFAALASSSWLQRLLIQNDFTHYQDVVTLMINIENLTPKTNTRIDCRDMEPADLPAIAHIDNTAFEPLWQNSYAQIEGAYRTCQITRVLETDGNVIGYSMSTANPFQVHLARLAVAREYQHQGYGYWLLQDLFEVSLSMRIGLVSLNTQDSNQNSLKLYKSTGFELTGDRLPVYAFPI